MPNGCASTRHAEIKLRSTWLAHGQRSFAALRCYFGAVFVAYFSIFCIHGCASPLPKLVIGILSFSFGAPRIVNPKKAPAVRGTGLPIIRRRLGNPLRAHQPAECAWLGYRVTFEPDSQRVSIAVPIGAGQCVCVLSLKQRISLTSPSWSVHRCVLCPVSCVCLSRFVSLSILSLFLCLFFIISFLSFLISLLQTKCMYIVRHGCFGPW